MDSPTSDALFSVGTSPLTEREAEQVALRSFGLPGNATLLTSERDQNFLLQAGDGRYVLKVSHPAEDRAVTDFQTRVQLRLMQTDPPLPVPRLVNCTDGSPIYWLPGDDGSHRAVRVNTFVAGRPMSTLPRTNAMSASLGTALARFDLALTGFHHEAASTQDLLWDIQHAGKLRPLMTHLVDQEQYRLAERYLNHFDSSVMPRLHGLRRQVIHNDLNPYNVFIEDDGRIGGIIDFGDMVEAPLINELAVALSYQLVFDAEPLSRAVECLKAYHSVIPLMPDELELLPDLIATRMLLTVLITTWRASLYPDNKAYILRNNPSSWAGLRALDKLTLGRARDIFLTACRYPLQPADANARAVPGRTA